MNAISILIHSHTHSSYFLFLRQEASGQFILPLAYGETLALCDCMFDQSMSECAPETEWGRVIVSKLKDYWSVEMRAMRDVAGHVAVKWEEGS